MSSNNTEDIFNSNELIKLAKKPAILVPLWEFFLAIIFAIVFSLFYFYGFFNTVENASIDYRFKQRGKLPSSKDIVLVSITDECIEKIGTWPWPRETHGKLLNILKKAGAKLAAFDIMFTEESLAGHEDDVKFAQAIANFGKVVLPQIVTKKTILDPETFETKEVISPDRPYQTLLEAKPYEGFIDLEYQQLNPDGVIRKLLLTKPAGDYYSYIFGLSAAGAYLGVNPEEVRGGMKIADRVLPYYTCYEPEAGRMVSSYLINYAGAYSHFDEISYSDVINEKFPKNYFSNRLVLIGTKAKGISEDVKFCPYGALSGVEIHANLLHNILNRRFLQRSSVTNTILLIFVFALSCAYLLWKNRSFSGNFICLSAALAWAALALILFNIDVILEVTPILFMIPIQWAVTRLIQQFVSLTEKNYELGKRVRELAIINEVTKTVSFMGDLGKTLDAILSRGVQALYAERGSLFMLDDRYEELVEQSVVYGIEGKAVFSENLIESFKSGKGIAGEVFNSGKAKLITNIRKEKSFKEKEGEVNTIKSMICVPLTIRETPIGVMNIVNKQSGRFNNDDLQIALTMANQAAVVIEKARLYNLATVDGLTGLVVRRHFQSKMEEEFRRARRYNKPLSYLMTDIDHFKKFNDTYGHQTGDAVLREVAKIVRKSVRDTDIAARYGGEEFCVILPETEPEGAVQFAERLRQSVESATFIGAQGEELKVTISIGVSSIPYTNPETAEDMIKLADDSLYVCKKNGRNRVELAHPGVVVDTSVPIPRT